MKWTEYYIHIINVLTWLRIHAYTFLSSSCLSGEKYKSTSESWPLDSRTSNKYLPLYPLNLQEMHDIELHIIPLKAPSLGLKSMGWSQLFGGIHRSPGGSVPSSYTWLMPAGPGLQSSAGLAEVAKNASASGCVPTVLYSSLGVFADIPRQLEESLLTSCHIELSPSY